jgi:SAM-dependent methyltransferase
VPPAAPDGPPDVVEFADRRLTELYDLVNPAGPDTEFYQDLAGRLDARTIVDLGCGTGLLISRLARPDRRLVGIDPAPEMLAVARGRTRDGDGTWVEGTSDALRDWGADLVVMTGHVAQILVDDDDWRATLASMRRTLRPGGWLAFESRNPSAQTWRTWTPEASHREVILPSGEPLEVWYDVVAVDGDRVTHEVHYRFAAPGPELVSTLELRYRSESALVEGLESAGFEVEHIFGDWDRSLVRESSPELIVVAVRR